MKKKFNFFIIVSQFVFEKPILLNTKLKYIAKIASNSKYFILVEMPLKCETVQSTVHNNISLEFLKYLLCTRKVISKFLFKFADELGISK